MPICVLILINQRNK